MKYCGKERGSITLFLALILSLLLSLVCTSIESVRMASARTQILNSMDIGLYSVFGQYDRKLLEEYDLFALDGSMGGGQLNLAKICDNLESYMKPAHIVTHELAQYTGAIGAAVLAYEKAGGKKTWN